MFLNISGFGDPDANGIYEEVGTSGGYPYYQKDEYFIVYRSQFMPYTVEGAYWLFKTVSTNGSKPIEKTEYVNFSTDINGEWISVLPQSSGEASAGTITEVMSSSSSFEPNS